MPSSTTTRGGTIAAAYSRCQSQRDLRIRHGQAYVQFQRSSSRKSFGAQVDPRKIFEAIRERLIKIGARVIEHAARIRIQLPMSYPEGALFRIVALGIMPAAP